MTAVPFSRSFARSSSAASRRATRSRFPDTYNGQPLGYIAIAARKNYFTLHLLSVYMNPSGQKALAEGFRKAGKKLDMGKACVRFKSLDDLPLDVIGDLVARITPEAWTFR